MSGGTLELVLLLLLQLPVQLLAAMQLHLL
jgi:hypothetical protein